MPVVQSNDTTNSFQRSTKSDIVYQHDSILVRDSTIYRERTIHDTVYITKEVYRDRTLSAVNAQVTTKTDTVIVTEWREKIIEPPPQKYVPKFYKWCTIALWVMVTLAAMVLIYRIRPH